MFRFFCREVCRNGTRQRFEDIFLPRKLHAEFRDYAVTIKKKNERFVAEGTNNLVLVVNSD